MRRLLRRFIPAIKCKIKRETVKDRTKRKQEDSVLARWRTAFGFGALIFQVLGFVITVAMFSLLIYIHFIR